MKRKYISEFGMHVYSSHVTICYPNDLQSLEVDHKYHIYMVNLIPKLKFVKDSIVIEKEGFSIDVSVQTENKNINETLMVSLHPLIDHTKFTFTLDKPLKSLTIKDKNGGGVITRILPFYLENSRQNLECEIVYIGQSFGKKGERDALDRLKSHSTLQKIQADHLFNNPESDIAVSLWEFTPRLLTSFDGKTKEYEKSSKEDKEHMLQILENPPLYINNQIINITEAALINYFKPNYNEKFKNNFPNIEHLGYKYYYDLDFNSLLVELDPDAIGLNLFSKEKNYHLFNAIEYTLHPEDVRKSMFDIFSEKKRP